MKKLLLPLMVFTCLFSFSQEKPIVVVELFTSEGCSSCPPADRLLSSIVNEAYENAEVIGLSFHVDYWDYIGWQDPYADSRFSKRQRDYARQLVSSVYTPQMVVNGSKQFVGSNKLHWKRTLTEATQKASVQPLEVRSSHLNGNRLSFSVISPSKGHVFNVAVVERDLSQNVNRGENRGRLLTHDNVVRAFASQVQKSDANSFELELPDDLDISKSSLVVYSQDQSDLMIVGAKKIELSTLQ